MATKVNVSVWPDDYPNVIVDTWYAEFSSRDRAVEYAEMLKKSFRGVSVKADGHDGIEITAFA